MTNGKDYYGVLGVHRHASEKEIKTAFHGLVKLWHPDRNKSLGADKKTEEIIEAYRVLSDPKARAQYDKWGHVPQGSGTPINMVDILAQIFKNVNESIKTQKKVCPVCYGRHWVSRSSSLFSMRIPCPKCSGNRPRNVG